MPGDDGVSTNEFTETASDDSQTGTSTGELDEGISKEVKKLRLNDDDGTLESLSKLKYDAVVNTISPGNEIAPENGESSDENEKVGLASVEENHTTTEPANESDDDDHAIESTSENNVAGYDAGYDYEFRMSSSMEGDGLDQGTKSLIVLPDIDNDDRDDGSTVSGKQIDDDGEDSTETDDIEEVASSATHIDAEDIEKVDPPATAYHRNQSIEGDEIVNDEVHDVGNEKPATDIPQENSTRAEDVENFSNENFSPTGGNGNSTTDVSPREEGPNQSPPGQGWDDSDNGTFFEMMQSTFNVILLAAFLTCFLVLRKRVRNRVQTNPTLSISDAIKDELVNCLVKLKSWVANAASATGERGANAESRSTSLRTNGSFRAETTPLSTAADEEWGWEDEDLGQRLELSTMGGDEEKEDNELALALAMSLAESQNDDDDYNSRSTPPAQSANKRFVGKSPSVKLSNSNSSRYNHSMTREEPKRKSITSNTQSSSGGGDSIEELLGRIGGNGGPVITSLGHKLEKSSKPKQQNGRSDDIFDSMGLSNYPSTTTSKPTRPVPVASGRQAPTSTTSKLSAPRSAPVQSLLADTVDADADSWGDDGDLDDLLDD